MSIAARCGDCQKLYKVDEKLAGKKVRCKVCGATVDIPEAAGPVVAPASVPAQSPARKPVARAVASGDPFDNLDALMSLEASGTVDDNPAPVYAPSKTRRAAVEVTDNVLAPPAYSPGRGVATAPSFVRPSNNNAYVSLPNEESIDAFVPLATIGVLIVFLIITFIRVMNAIPSDAPEGATGKVFGYMVGFNTGLLGVIFGVLAPLCMLGVFIASKIMKFQAPGGFYLRCAAVVCAPISLGILLNGFGFGEPTTMGWVVSLPVLLAVLWLMFRLKLLPYLVNGAFTLLCLVGIPMLLVLALSHSLSATLSGLAQLTGGSQSHNRDTVKSIANLRLMGNAIQLYANENKGAYPPTLEALTKVNGFGAESLQSPLGSEKYVYLYFPGMRTTLSSDYAVAYDPNVEVGKPIPVLFGDGHAALMTSADFTAAKLRNERIHHGQTATANPVRTATPPPTIVARDPGKPVTPIDLSAHHAAVETWMKRIADALKKYADAHDGKYPNSMFELTRTGFLTTPELQGPDGAWTIYEGAFLKAPVSEKIVLFFEEGSKDKKRTVIWGDLRVETLDDSGWRKTISESRSLKAAARR